MAPKGFRNRALVRLQDINLAVLKDTVAKMHRKKMKRPEQSLHIQVANYLRLAIRPPVFWTSIDHGVGKLGVVEASLRKARGVKAGLPDILIMRWGAMNSTAVIGIELKAKGGSLSPAQKEMQTLFKGVAADYHVCRSLDDVIEVLNEHGIYLYAKV